jgi:hypothetical protein
MSDEIFGYFLEKLELFLRRKDDCISHVTFDNIADCVLEAKIATELKFNCRLEVQENE